MLEIRRWFVGKWIFYDCYYGNYIVYDWFFFGVIWYWNRILWFFWNCNMVCGVIIKEDLYVNIENFVMKISRNEEKVFFLW